MLFLWILSFLFGGVDAIHPDHYLVSCCRGVLHPPGQQPTPIGSDSLTVYVFLHNECVISQFYTPRLNEFYEEFHPKKVGFVGFFPDFSCKPYDVKAFAEKYHISFPLKSDYYKDWSRKFGVKVMPEAAVWDHRSDRLIYRGRIDDSYVRVGKRKTHIQNEDLKNVIEGWLAGNVPSDTIETQAIGCFINFTDQLSRKPINGEQ